MPEKNILVVANRKSGASDRSKLVADLVHALSDLGYCADVLHDLDVVAERARFLAQSGELHAVVGAGGDGTASAVVARLPDGIPFYPYPLGTENLLARQFGIVAEPKASARAIDQCQTRTLDAAEANGKIFLLMLGIGFDAHVVDQVHSQRKGHVKRMDYWAAIARSIWSYRFPELRYTILDTGSDRPKLSHGEERASSSSAVRWIFIVNLPLYASGLQMAPWASAQDGKLDVCTFRGGGLLRGIGYLLALRLRRQTQLRDFQALSCRELRVESTERVPYQVDGDAGGFLPLQVKVLPQHYRLILPTTSPAT